MNLDQQILERHSNELQLEGFETISVIALRPNDPHAKCLVIGDGLKLLSAFTVQMGSMLKELIARGSITRQQADHIISINNASIRKSVSQ